MQIRRTRPSPGITSTAVRGVVKWFNAAKGYGFVKLDNGLPDAFLHISVLEQAGHRDVGEGAVVTCDLSDGNRGPQVAAIHSVEADAEGGDGMSMGRSDMGGPRPSMDEEGPIDGVVKFFNVEKGFGFIRPDNGGKDVFVSLRTLQRAGLTALDADQRVRMWVRQGQKGPMAETVEID